MASRFSFLFFASFFFLQLVSGQALATTVEISIDEIQGEIATPLHNNELLDTSVMTSQKLVKSLAGRGAPIASADISNAGVSAVKASRKQAVLLLRVSFTDQDFSFRREDFHSLMFSTQAQASSVANYYLENSYQDFLLVPAVESQGQKNDGIVDVKLPYKHPDFGASYGGASAGLVRDAMSRAEAFIDLADYDRNRDRRLDASELAIVLMVAGYENAYGGTSAPKPNVWAHKADIVSHHQGVALTSYAMFGERHQNHLATIGIVSHEMGHLLFSLPDLYDRQWDSNGVGRWGLMGLGSWNSQGGYSGSSPAHMLAWSKVKAGFLQPEDVTGGELAFDLASTSEGPEAMRIWLDPFRHGEHFLLEYRTKTSLDKALPGHGLLISHVDDWVGYGNGGPQNDVAEHKLVDIEEADGRQDLDQLQNRGDHQDVYNDAYGQDYFGSSSLPASLDYHGNTSGVEVYDIKVGETVSGLVTLPYQKLGNNLGYDEGGIGSAWGQTAGRSESMMRVALSTMTWLHGVDVYSHGHGVLELNVFSQYETQALSGLLVGLEGQLLTPGWNRLSFAQPVSAAGLDQVFVHLVAEMQVGRPFSIDFNGEVSGRSYTMSGAGYSPANFDFNQRLLVADQAEPFTYQVPKKLNYQQLDNNVAAASLAFDWPSGLLFFIALLALTVRGKAGR